MLTAREEIDLKGRVGRPRRIFSNVFLISNATCLWYIQQLHPNYLQAIAPEATQHVRLADKETYNTWVSCTSTFQKDKPAQIKAAECVKGGGNDLMRPTGKEASNSRCVRLTPPPKTTPRAWQYIRGGWGQLSRFVWVDMPPQWWPCQHQSLSVLLYPGSQGEVLLWHVDTGCINHVIWLPISGHVMRNIYQTMHPLHSLITRVEIYG